MSVFLSCVCLFKILGGFMKWGLRNQGTEKWLLSYVYTTLYFSFFFSNNMELFCKVRKCKKMFEYTTMDLTQL